jgi:uncharacterized membrane protein
MLKKIYVFAWILLGLLALSSLWGGYFDSVAQVAFMVAVLVLVCAPALWSVFSDTRDDKLQIFSRNDELNSTGGKG